MIVFVLRHADKKLHPGADDLTPAGVARAELLARMLAESGISVAYCSTAVRAQLTLKPLQDLLGTKLTVHPIAIDGSGQPQKHVDTIVGAVQLLGSDVVAAIVGHTDTVPAIIEGLGGGTINPIENDEFDKFFMLFEGPAGRNLLRLRYGPAS